MSELMAVESVVEAEWLLNGYWTKARYPFKTPNGGWSDIDVVAYSPDDKHLVISESKVRGQKNLVMAYTEESKENWGSIVDYDNDYYLSFLKHLPVHCRDGGIFRSFSDSVRHLTVQLVSNYVIDSSLVAEAQGAVLEAVKESMRRSPSRTGTHLVEVETDVLLDTTLDVFARILECERRKDQGRRHGHPVLDLAREINRYLAPAVRYAGQGKAKTDPVREQGLRLFLGALNGGRHADPSYETKRP